MIEKKHNDFSKQFFQKLLIFIDTSIMKIAIADSDNVASISINTLINLKDAIFSEIVRENFLDEIKNSIQKEKNEKENKKKENDQSDLNLDQE